MKPETVWTEGRCTKRVWDNGDMEDCGREKPCPIHALSDEERKKRLLMWQEDDGA